MHVHGLVLEIAVRIEVDLFSQQCCRNASMEAIGNNELKDAQVGKHG
jgi:hypothetical protein